MKNGLNTGESFRMLGFSGTNCHASRRILRRPIRHR
jgi:hypothetical protein